MPRPRPRPTSTLTSATTARWLYLIAEARWCRAEPHGPSERRVTGSVSAAARRSAAARGGTAWRGAARRRSCRSRSHSQSRCSSRLDLGGRLAVALAAARQPVEAHRLAPRDRDRREVADLPGLRAVDRARRRPARPPAAPTIAAPGCTSPGHAAALPRPLDEDAERVARRARPRACAARPRGPTRRAARANVPNARMSSPEPGHRVRLRPSRGSRALRGHDAAERRDVDPARSG